jgi:tryptophan synthase alpha chain
MIPFYPDEERSARVVRALVDADVSYLEIQFPFSDPTADGPTIQAACSDALAGGFTIARGWEFVAAAIAGGAPPVFLMSYASPVFTAGVDLFVRRARQVGVHGLIVPDLPFDADEGLYEAGTRHGVAIVPVVAPDTTDGRIAAIHALAPRYVYASLRRGITGARTEIGSDNISFLDRLRRDGTEIMAGFGIVDAQQVRAVVDHADVAVVGSQIVRTIPEEGDPYAAVRAYVSSLVEA